MAKLAKDYGSLEIVEKLLAEDHSLVRFYLPESARLENITKQTTGIGEYLTDAVRTLARENPRLQGVVNIVDFNATTAGKRIITAEKLKALVDVLGRYRLGLNDVEPDILGRAYEYLLRKFAEGSGQSAGEFYTPREVAILMARILNPEPGAEIYDPCCGSGGLLIKHIDGVFLVFFEFGTSIVNRHMAGEASDIARRIPNTTMGAWFVFLQSWNCLFISLLLAIHTIVASGHVGL